MIDFPKVGNRIDTKAVTDEIFLHLQDDGELGIIFLDESYIQKVNLKFHKSLSFSIYQISKYESLISLSIFMTAEHYCNQNDNLANIYNGYLIY